MAGGRGGQARSGAALTTECGSVRSFQERLVSGVSWCLRMLRKGRGGGTESAPAFKSKGPHPPINTCDAGTSGHRDSPGELPLSWGPGKVEPQIVLLLGEAVLSGGQFGSRI